MRKVRFRCIVFALNDSRYQSRLVFWDLTFKLYHFWFKSDIIFFVPVHSSFHNDYCIALNHQYADELITFGIVNWWSVRIQRSDFASHILAKNLFKRRSPFELS